MTIIANLILWLIVVWTLTSLHLPGNSLFINALQNSGHGAVFFIVSAVALWSLRAKKRNTPLRVTLCLVLILLVGVGIEVVQAFSGRGISMLDLLLNAGGTCTAYSIFLAIHSKRQTIKISAYLMAIILTSWCFHQPAEYLTATIFAKPLPILADFERVGSMAKVQPDNTTLNEGNHASIWPANSSRSLKVDFHPGRWPSVRFLEPYPEWVEYSQFTFQVMNTTQRVLPIRIRVDDASIEYPDRSFMIAKRNLMPGLNHVSVSLEELAIDARGGSSPSFKQISQFLFFLPNNEFDVTLVFDEIVLR